MCMFEVNFLLCKNLSSNYAHKIIYNIIYKIKITIKVIIFLNKFKKINFFYIINTFYNLIY